MSLHADDDDDPPATSTTRYRNCFLPLCLCVCTPQILFVWVNVNEHRNGRLMEYFRVQGFEAPLVRLVNLTDHVTYHLPSESLDAGTIKLFCQSYLEGRAKVDPASF